jgi:uncharacterized membrane protein
LWLIFLELTVVRIGITFDLHYHAWTFGQTIWALGWSMIVLAALVHLPTKGIAAFGLIMVGVHNAFDGMRVPQWRPGGPDLTALQKFEMILHQPGRFPIGGANGTVFGNFYPLIPWIGVMAAGYAFGALYTMDAADRRRILIRLGGALVALFVLLRATNLYGDAQPWSVQKNAAFTMLSFLNVVKYPPSLLYLCMTIGPGILFLAYAERERRGRLGAALVTFGRVPMLFYLLQFYVAHLLAFAAFMAVGKPTGALYLGPANHPSPAVLAQSGFDLWVTYAFWIIGVLLIYPICRWHADVKRRRNDWWLSYI